MKIKNDIYIINSPISFGDKVLDYCHTGLTNIKNNSIRIDLNDFLKLPDLKNKIAITWSYHQGDTLKETGCTHIVNELGYIGTKNRFKYTSLGIGGLNNYASFYQYPCDNGIRFKEQGGFLKDWVFNKKGYVLILGQVKGDSSLKGMDMQNIYMSWINKLKSLGEKVIFRHHPDSLVKNIAWDIPEELFSKNSDLISDITGAKYNLSFNSNSCVDSILNGIPCVAMDKGTMFYDLCGKELGEIITPDRESIAYSLAWKQFKKEELEEGWPLKNILSIINK